MRIALATLLVVLLASCSGGSDSPPAGDPPEQTGPAPPEAEEDERATSSFRPRDIDLDLEPVGRGFEAPLIVTEAGDGSGKLYVGEQAGRVWAMDDGGRAETPFLDISSRLVAGGERGLLGLAFHPSFEKNGRLFVNYTDLDGHTVVAEYQASGERADPDSERILLRIEQPYANHNGGHLLFGPDGHLYIATGDGGAGGDPDGNGQDVGVLLGKILRIDVDSESGDRPYAIPRNNPFVDRDGAAPEIWAYGLRNPWRFAFDPETESIWIADVGQNTFEEINAAPWDEGGINYGWAVMEGRDCFEAESCDNDGMMMPVAQYGRDGGCSVTGGAVYRGERYPDMRGGYFFADFCSGNIWALRADGPEDGKIVQIMTSGRSISSFGTDEDGELYLTDLQSGEVLRLGDSS